jgi:hypothetical protein
MKRISKTKLSIHLETIAALDDVAGGVPPPRVLITTHQRVVTMFRKPGKTVFICGHSFDPTCGIACR